MEIEILTIGDELLSGHTVDGNSAYLASRLLDIGFNVKYKSSTGDALEMMEDAFRLALSRAKIIITTGGLGPTDDDNTKKAIVKVFKRNLIYHDDILDDLKKRYQRRGIEMPAINQNQALLPQGADFFPNKNGSAVGLCIAEQGRIFISLPGVPSEMRQIFEDEVIPYLSELKVSQNIKVMKLRTTGIVESKLAELINPVFTPDNIVKLAYLPTFSGVDLRIIATSDNVSEAEARLYEATQQLESVAGKYIYGRNDETLPEIIGQLLKDNDKKLAVAESCTAGLLGAEITSVAGSSDWFAGGVISYSDEIKKSVLNVDANIIETDGAVSQACAKAMAAGVRELTGADYALAVTGIAGPDGSTVDKPIGTTWIALASAHDQSARIFNFGTDRNSNRRRAVFAALEMLRRNILEIL